MMNRSMQSRALALRAVLVLSFSILLSEAAVAAPPMEPVAVDVAGSCSVTDDGEVLCKYCSGPDAPATVFAKGPEYSTGASIVCLKDLGEFDPVTGLKIGSNLDAGTGKYHLNGRYLRTDVQSLPPAVGRFSPSANDFIVNPAGANDNEARQSALWSSEVHLYHYVTSYRNKVITPSFVNSLLLSSDKASNLLYRQYRPDLSGLVNARLPWLIPTELLSFTPWTTDLGANNFASPTKQRTSVSAPLDSLAFDPGYVVGQYSAALGNWITEGPAQWPTDANWGAVGNVSWKSDVRPAILEGFKAWNAFRMNGDPEVYRYASRVMRRWTGYACGSGNNQILCNKGWRIDNAMMYLDTADPAFNNPTNPSWPSSNSDDTLLFPYATNFPTTGVRNGNGTGHFGPTGGALGGLFVAALFYDLSKEVGVGDVKADQIFWKTISLINPSLPLSMTDFGVKIQQAARLLFPSTINPSVSWYEQDLVDLLSSRGIRVNGVSDFLQNWPPALGSPANPGPGSMNVSNSAGLGSSIPETQRNSSTGYNFLSYFNNAYTVSTPGTQYATYQFYKYSRYGPCDSVDMTNGTFNIPAATSNPIMNYDGSMAVSFSSRELANTLLTVPGTKLNFLRRRQSCVSEKEGYYPEDIRGTGFRAIKVIPNGFTFTAERQSSTSQKITYKLTIVDPSVGLSGPNTGPASYSWIFTAYNGAVVTAGGTVVTYQAWRDQPFTLSITRSRGSQDDVVTLRERGNDLDRASGQAFNKDFWNVGYPVQFDTIIGRRLVEGHGSYNSALNPVGGAFGVQGRRWKTPNYKVQPLRFSTVSHGIGSGQNQNGPYKFDEAVYYNACIWSSRENVTSFPGCSTNDQGNLEVQVPFSAVGITLGDPFATVTSSSYPAYLWTVNYPESWRLQPNTEYHFGSHISASVITNGYSYQVCSYAQAAWDGVTPGNEADKSDWLAGANWSGGNAPPPQTMRDYSDQSGSVSNCTYSAYKFEGKTVPE